MNKEILDKTLLEEPNNRNPMIRIMGISVIVILIFFLLEILRYFVPENLYGEGGTAIQTIGLLILLLVVIVSLLITNELNKIKPVLNIIKVVALAGIIIFATELIFKLTQNIIVSKNEVGLNFIPILIGSGFYSLLGMLVSNIRIHKLRGKKRLVPVLTLIGVWILLALLLKFFGG